MVNPLIVVQQNKNSNPERMKEDSKTLRPGLVLSNAKSLRMVCLLTALGFSAVEGERASSAALKKFCAAEVPVSPPAVTGSEGSIPITLYDCAPTSFSCITLASRIHSKA